MSCLFDSLGHFVQGTAHNLRLGIVDYLRGNPDMMGDGLETKDLVQITEGMPLEQYASRMSSPAAWGGALEIRAFCEMYGMDVRVHVRRQQKQISFECSRQRPGCYRRTVHVSWNGSHYEPMYITQLIKSRP